MMATYHQSAIPMDDFINSIPRDALAEALLFALEENKAGHCISNSQIESMINELHGMEIVWSKLAYEHFLEILIYVENNFGMLTAQKTRQKIQDKVNL